MASHQQDNTFEIKIPFFCEWTFEKGLPDAAGNPRSLYKYANDIADATGNDYLIPVKYSLPGFPGIQYWFSIFMEEEQYLELQLEIKMHYRSFIFDADFTSTITDFEPQQFNYKFDNVNVKKYCDTIKSAVLHTCLHECAGCPVCEPNKKIVLRAEGIFTVKHVKAFWYFPFKNSEEISKLRNEKIDTKDFVIVVEEQEIRVHKSVLAEHSTVFARMFDSDNWKETMENKIVIPDFSYEIIKFAIDACCGKAFFNPLNTKEEYLSFFQFADKYDMKKLIKAVKNVIDFTPFNAVEYANFFFQNNAIELINCCIDYILSCSQYSLPIKDIDLLDAQIRSMSFDRMLVSSVLKKDPKAEHRHYDYDGEFKDDED